MNDVTADEGGRGRLGAGWLALALGSLIAAGAFAIFLVIGRVPPFSGWLGSAAFFKRCLVVHVDLSIVVWFHAFTACLFTLIPARNTRPQVGRLGLALALLGVATLFSCIFIEGASPILSNYVPSLDHPLFLAGIALFFLGVAVSFLDGRLLPGRELPVGPVAVPPEARPGLRAAALAFLFAVLTFAASALSTPPGLLPETRNEFLFWGGGHVLQVSSVASMLTVWLMLIIPTLGGQAPFSRRTSTWLFGALVLPTAFAPLLALAGTNQVAVHDGFTQLMRWGIFPVVSVFGFFCLRAVWRAVREKRVRPLEPRLLGFYASVLLTAVGFGLGAAIRGSNTLVPAHYHASIGAVTVSFMAFTYQLFDAWNLRHVGRRLYRWRKWQPALFGVGQAVFASGFALAGAQGMARKTYASEQHIRTSLEWLGLVVMGVGGLVAVGAGILFLAYVIKAGLFAGPRRVGTVAPEGSAPWPHALQNTQSRR